MKIGTVEDVGFHPISQHQKQHFCKAIKRLFLHVRKLLKYLDSICTIKLSLQVMTEK